MFAKATEPHFGKFRRHLKMVIRKPKEKIFQDRFFSGKFKQEDNATNSTLKVKKVSIFNLQLL